MLDVASCKITCINSLSDSAQACTCTGLINVFLTGELRHMIAFYVQGGVTPIGAVSRAVTGVKIFDRLKMALTA